MSIKIHLLRQVWHNPLYNFHDRSYHPFHKYIYHYFSYNLMYIILVNLSHLA